MSLFKTHFKKNLNTIKVTQGKPDHFDGLLRISTKASDGELLCEKRIVGSSEGETLDKLVSEANLVQAAIKNKFPDVPATVYVEVEFPDLQHAGQLKKVTAYRKSDYILESVALTRSLQVWFYAESEFYKNPKKNPDPKVMRLRKPQYNNYLKMGTPAEDLLSETYSATTWLQEIEAKKKS